MEKRLIWSDIVRIMAVYFILILHVNALPDPAQTNFFFSMGITLADTCVPLLVMLSGALLLGKKESYTLFFGKRIARVVIPWLTWTILFTAIVLYFQAEVTIGSIIHTFHAIFIPFFWFIVLVCALYAITPALRIFVQAAKTRDSIVVILLWYCALSLLPYIRNTQAFPLAVGNNITQLIITFFGYFLLGYLIISIKLQKNYTLLLGGIFLISFLLRSFLEYSTLHTHTNLISGSNFIDPTLIIVSASLFSLIYLGEATYQRLFTLSIKKLLATVSKATLGIYFVHYLFLNRAPLPFFLPSPSLVHLSDSTDMFINAFIIFTISFFIIFLLQKIPLVKYLVT